MKKLSALLFLPLLLAACVDSTGISPTSNHPPRGNPNATVIVREFADMQCPACKTAHETINPLILEKYGDKIRFEFHHFPLRNIHRFALDLAEGSECSADQGKFWEFVDMAYAKQAELKKGAVQAWGKELGLDMDLFYRCTASHIKRAGILASYDAGVAAGAKGTPTYFVNTTKVDSTTDDLSIAIEASLKGGGGPKL